MERITSFLAPRKLSIGKPGETGLPWLLPKVSCPPVLAGEKGRERGLVQPPASFEAKVCANLILVRLSNATIGPKVVGALQGPLRTQVRDLG